MPAIEVCQSKKLAQAESNRGQARSYRSFIHKEPSQIRCRNPFPLGDALRRTHLEFSADQRPFVLNRAHQQAQSMSWTIIASVWM